MRTGPRAAVTAVAAVALLVPLGVTATDAAWNDREWVQGDVGTASLACGADEGFAARSFGRFLSGELLGIDLDPIADLEQMTLGVDDAGARQIEPADAIDLGSTPTSATYANPFDVTLVNALGVSMTGFSVPLPGATLGAANQYARVSSLGEATGASGLVNDSGAVLVSASTPSSALPAPATVRIGTLLPAIAGITDARLQVGAVAASSQLDGCAALREQIWADTASSATAVRDYGIAGLGLQVDSPAVSGLVGAVNSGVADIQAAVALLLGSSGVISTALGARLDASLPGILTTRIGGSVTIAGLDLAGSVSALLTTPLTDGVVTIDLASGTIQVDLDALLPSLNDANPNTEVVLSPAVLNPIVTRAGALLNAWTTQITAALTQELRDASLTIDLAAVVAAPGITIPGVPPLVPPVILPGLDVLNVSIDFTGTVGAILGGAPLVVSAEAAGAVGAINTLLSALGLPSVTALIATVNVLGSVLAASVVNAITTTVLTVITTLGTTLASTVTQILTALGGVVNALPTVLSIMVNVQPDQPNAPPGPAPLAATGRSTAQYVVSALRIGLADAAVPADVAHVLFATASAGPVTAP